MTRPPTLKTRGDSTPIQVGALRSLASRHLGTLGRGMGMGPFQPPPQPLTPKGRLPAAALQPGPQPPRSISTPPLRCHTPVLLSGEPVYHREGRGGGGGGGAGGGGGIAAASGIQSSLPHLVVPNPATADVEAGTGTAGAGTGPSAGFLSPQHNITAANSGVRFSGGALSLGGALPSRPATALSVQDLNLSARPGSRMGPPPGTPPSRSHLGTGSSSFSATGRTNLPGNASPLRGGYRHTVTKRLIETSPAAAAAAEANRLGGFRVTRGMMYSVFQELDEYDSGRLTYSAFEQAACRIGMRPTQARRLFDQ